MFRSLLLAHRMANITILFARLRWILVNWSFDSGDSIRATPAESNAAYDKLVKDYPSSVLSLDHEVYSTFLFFSFDIRWTESSMLSLDTIAFMVAPHAIKVLQSAGYKLVTVAECLSQQPYLSTGPPTAARCSSLTIPRLTFFVFFS